VSTLTAEESLRIAVHVNRGKSSAKGLLHRLRTVALIFTVSIALVVVCAYLLWAKLVVGDAVRAILSLSVLGTLTMVASIYSMAGIAWNAYWMERLKRIESEAELYEVLCNTSQIVIKAMCQLPDQKQFGDVVASCDQQMEVTGDISTGSREKFAAKLIRDLAVSGLVSQELIRASVSLMERKG
jgi:hypothetical protein